ncbi:MAG: hypothetical protein Q9162_006918 [Coniocarpon cinnabarinum]
MAVDTRIEDYLNDKFQTFADFEALDALIANVENQQELLKQQLVEAQHDVEASQHEATQHEDEARRRASAFNQQQADIDRRLTIITNSDTADEAVERFEDNIKSLRKLDITDQYLRMLQDVETLNDRARRELQSNPSDAIAKHANLYSLFTELLVLQRAAEGAAPHLIDFVERSVTDLRSHMRETFAQQLEQVMDKILWPKKTVALPMSLLEGFNTAVGRLLALQKPVMEYQDESAQMQNSSPAETLYPLQVMIEPMAARFQYHFSGDRPTNRLDKPEYFLNNFFDMLNDHVDFINEYLQPLLLQAFHGSMTILDQPVYIDATTAFIHALLPMVRQRLLSIIGPVSSQPQPLSHLIAELLDFDLKLTNDWRYSPSPTSTWKGLTWELLTQHNVFPRWLQVEKDFALARYNTIIDDKTTATLDFESTTHSSHTSVPTTAAMRVHDLLTTLTHTFRDIPSFSHRFAFFFEVQLDILDLFHSHLSSHLRDFLAMTSAFGRVQGVSARDQADLMGVSGLDRLARVYGSLEYLERAMADWSDDVFFLEMWAELQSTFRSPDARDVFAGLLDVSTITDKTSAHLANGSDEDASSGSVFDETTGHYAIRRAKAEDAMIETLRSSVKESLRPYSRSASFASTTDGFIEADLALSPDLQGTTRVLSQCFEFLAKALGAAPLRRILRAVMNMVDDFLFERVVLARDFSIQGAQQFNVDVAALLRAAAPVTGRKVGMVQLRRTGDSLRLLLLPVQGEAGGADGGKTETRHGAFDLWDVEKRVFATNEDARVVLAEVGCAQLNVNEARKVLQSRVELET